MPRSMTSLEVKNLLIRRFNFFNGYVGAVTEAANLNAADVIAVKHGGKVQEYEIKLSRSDLVGELRCARVAKGLEDLSNYTKKSVQLALDSTPDMTDDQRDVLLKHGHALSKTKLKNHRLYLTGEGREGRSFYGFPPPKPFVPHTFYWCIPHELLDICRRLNE